MRDAQIGITVSPMSIETFTQSVAEAVTGRQREAGMPTATLAELSGIPRTTLQRRQINGDFTLLELISISPVLKTTPEALLVEARCIDQRIAS